MLPAFDKCPNEGKDEQLRSLLQHSFDELKLRYDGHVAAKKKKGDWSREQEQATSHYSRGKLLETA